MHDPHRTVIHSARALRIALGTLLCLVALVLAWARIRDPGAVGVGPEARSGERPTDVLLDDAAGPRRTAVETAVQEVAPQIGTVSTQAEPEPLEIEGQVLEANGEGVNGVNVLVRGRRGSEHSGTARTDRDGRFAMRLEASEWRSGELASVHVSNDAGERLFSGVIILGKQVTILLPEALLLVGKLVDLPSRELEQLSMRFDVPAANRFDSNLFVGKTVLDEGGSFALMARPPVASEDFLLTFFQGNKPLAAITVKVAELTKAGGAELDLGLGRLRLAFKDSAGSALQGVQVEAATIGSSGAMPHLSESSGPDGIVILVLPRGQVELCASRQDLATNVWVTDSFEGAEVRTEPVVLSKLQDEVILKGTVVLADGSPLAGASVSVFPRSDTGVGFGARTSASTSEDGTFSTPVRFDDRIEVVVVHPRHGWGPKTILPPWTREARIQFESQGEVVLELEVAPTETVTRPGPIECLLVDHNGGNFIQRHVRGSPSPLRNIPAGAYSLFVFWPGMDVFGMVPVALQQGEKTNCRVRLAPARWLSGVIIEASGEPIASASVELDPGEQSPDLPRAWSRATSGSDGSFRLLLGGRSRRLELLVHTADGRTARWSGAFGPARVVVSED